MWCKDGAAGSAHLQNVRGGADDLLSVREVAQRLRVSRFLVYQLCTRRGLPHVRVSNAIRIAPADLAAYLARISD
jgi:excisionase family DNA binding protein